MSGLRALTLSDNPAFQSFLERRLEKVPGLHLLHGKPGLPVSVSELELLLDVHEPTVLFLDASDAGRALKVAEAARSLSARTHIISVGESDDSELILGLMRCGVREFLRCPFDLADLAQALHRIEKLLAQEPPVRNRTRRVLGFLPAKPGVGASTICLNTASAIARARSGNVCLLDLDFFCGSLDFLLQLPAGFSVRDALEHAHQLEPVIWAKLVSRCAGMDVLRSDKSLPQSWQTPERVRQLIRYAARSYETVMVDLPGGLDPCSLAAMETMNHIFLTTTQEAGALYMAQRALEMLEERGLGDHTFVVLNRVDAKNGLSLEQIEELLGRKVLASFPNDYAAVQRSAVMGRVLPPETALGNRYHEFARMIQGEPQANPTNRSWWSRLVAR